MYVSIYIYTYIYTYICPVLELARRGRYTYCLYISIYIYIYNLSSSWRVEGRYTSWAVISLYASLYVSAKESRAGTHAVTATSSSATIARACAISALVTESCD